LFDIPLVPYLARQQRFRLFFQATPAAPRVFNSQSRKALAAEYLSLPVVNMDGLGAGFGGHAVEAVLDNSRFWCE